MRILVVEDDAVLGEAIEFALKISNYAVDRVGTGATADQVLKRHTFDLVILDLGLPTVDGFEVLRRLRARLNATPVLVLSARDAPDDKARVLDLGADDYLAKPFSVNEFLARVRALLRRSQYGPAPRVLREGVSYDAVTRTLQVNGRVLPLSPREIGVFEVLLQHFGRVVSKEQLLERLYGFDDSVTFNAIEVYVHRLRKKLENTGITVRTFHGRGYQLDHGHPH
ncbi:MAG: DNA-binding response regulator [Azospira oryzae]|uniref:Response regulator transcription factor n=1 Tax=Pelomicrobium methylotrophicum TaxID=2602750 RepID=A0A5C7F1N9_9PROT|nr:response regulator transcription factor [Pelomicrobium methylotrophicum]PZP65067.1 MAG: DNA-binding response regulator [Azospira oryzae]PZP83026.1 MAG: DNA-binding response regulator [Azospira oryzae]TXF13698.1 response regulator transcription factor [Pelomicrobium methylotrophicum]